MTVRHANGTAYRCYIPLVEAAEGEGGEAGSALSSGVSILL